jgi:hypothetical protein
LFDYWWKSFFDEFTEWLDARVNYQLVLEVSQPFENGVALVTIERLDRLSHSFVATNGVYRSDKLENLG